MNIPHFLYFFFNFALVISLSFMNLDPAYLIKYNWIICEPESTLAKCSLNAVITFPHCWADRKHRDSQGFIFHNPSLQMEKEIINGHYIVQGLCYNSKLTSSNDIMFSQVNFTFNYVDQIMNGNITVTK